MIGDRKFNLFERWLVGWADFIDGLLAIISFGIIQTQLGFMMSLIISRYLQTGKIVLRKWMKSGQEE